MTTSYTSSRQQIPWSQLPEELWECIARHMSLREWAKACGACRVMHTVQLKRVVAEPRRVLPLWWVAKRWHQARFIDLSLSSLAHVSVGKNPCMPELDWIVRTQMKYFKHSFRGLSHLSLNLSLGIFGPFASTEFWVDDILAQADKLEVLHINCYKSPDLAGLGNLIHLFMNVGSLDWDFSAPFCNLKRVQTMVLRSNARNGDDQRGGCLDLQACTVLTYVVLQGGMPEKLLLPPQTCSVCVEGQPQHCMERLHELCCSTYHLYTEYNDQDVLLVPGHLRAYGSQLVHLSISLTQFGKRIGTPESPLEITSALKCLRHLRVVSRNHICMTFGPNVCLETVSLKGSNLNMAFADTVSKFAHGLKSAYLSWIGDAPQTLTALLSTLNFLGKPCAVLGATDDENWKLTRTHASLGELRFGCTCECCETCLIRAGIMPEVVCMIHNWC